MYTKLISVATQAQFNTILAGNNPFPSTSVVIIEDTLLLWTHGLFINGVTATAGVGADVTLKIAGTNYKLALSDYVLKKNEDVDLGLHTHTEGVLTYSKSYQIKADTHKLLEFSLKPGFLGLHLGSYSDYTIFDSQYELKRMYVDGAYTYTYPILDTSNITFSTTNNQNVVTNVLTYNFANAYSGTIYYALHDSSSTAPQSNTNTYNTRLGGNSTEGWIVMNTGSTGISLTYYLIKVTSTSELYVKGSSTTNFTKIISENDVFSGGSSSSAGTVGLVPAPTTNDSLFLRSNGTWDSINLNITSALYVGMANGTGNALVSFTPYLIFLEGNSYSRYKLEGDGGITVSSDSYGNIKFTGTTYSNFTSATSSAAGTSGLVPGPFANLLGSNGYFLRADGTWAIPTDTWVAADFTHSGYVPNSVKGKYLHANADTGVLEWVDDRYEANTDKTGVKKGTAGSTNITNGSVISVDSSTGMVFEGGTNQFKIGNGTNSITINVAHGLSTFVKSGANAASGLVPQPSATEGTTKFLCEDGTWKVPTYTSDTNTWRNISVNGTLKLNTDITSGGLDIINGTNTTVEWTNLNKLKINSTNTWIAWVGASSNANGTAGYMPAPTIALRNLFLRGDGTWCDLNNYSLPVATDRSLGGVKVGTTLTNETGYTKVHIKDDFIYYHDTTYTFYNLVFNSGVSDVFTYDPDGSSNKKIIKGSNIDFAVNGNNLTISSTNTWKQNTATLEGYVSAPGVNVSGKVWMTGSDGTPSWQDANNHSHSYLPLTGGTISDGNNWTTIEFSRTGVGTGNIGGVDNNGLHFSHYIDNYSISMYLKANDGLRVNGTLVSLDGHKHSYTDLTGSTTIADQVIVSNGTANGWTLKTLGSNAFNSTVYAIPDDTAILTTTKAITANTWTDTELSYSTTGLATSGTYAVLIIYSNDIYSGIMSWYAGSGGAAEEVELHCASNRTPGDARIYLKTEGGKLYIAADGAVSSLTYTIKIRKLI